MKLTDDSIKKLGIILTEERKKKNYTQEQVKIKLESMGHLVNRSDIQRIEKGERKIPNAILLKNLCKIYKIDVIKVFEEIGYLDKNKSENKSDKKIKLYKNYSNFIEKIKELEEIDIPIQDKDNVIGIKINDNSMEPKVSTGDIILINKVMKIENSEIGLFKIGDQIILRKKMINDMGDIILMSLNNSYFPIVINKENDFEELGKLVGRINLN